MWLQHMFYSINLDNVDYISLVLINPKKNKYELVANTVTGGEIILSGELTKNKALDLIRDIAKATQDGKKWHVLTNYIEEE